MMFSQRWLSVGVRSAFIAMRFSSSGVPEFDAARGGH
jgi:hypothetical protein